MTVKHQRTASQLLYSYSEQRKKRSAKFELFQTQLPCFLELGGTVALRLLHKYRHANREKTHGNQENIFISMTAHTQHLGGKNTARWRKPQEIEKKADSPTKQKQHIKIQKQAADTGRACKCGKAQNTQTQCKLCRRWEVEFTSVKLLWVWFHDSDIM